MSTKFSKKFRFEKKNYDKKLQSNFKCKKPRATPLSNSRVLKLSCANNEIERNNLNQNQEYQVLSKLSTTSNEAKNLKGSCANVDHRHPSRV